MSDKPPPFIIVTGEQVAEALILFSTLREQFSKVGVTFADESLTNAVGLDNSDEYLKHIDDNIIKRFYYLLENMTNEGDLYYHYYGAFVGYFIDFTPKCDNDLYKVIVTTFLVIISIILPQFKNSIPDMKRIGMLDESARLIIKAAIDARNYVVK